jgi:hypothetical protein
MDRKTKVAIILAAVLLVDNVRIGLKNIRLQRISKIWEDNADTMKDLFLTTCKYVPDQNVSALKDDCAFVMVTHGHIPPQD